MTPASRLVWRLRGSALGRRLRRAGWVRTFLEGRAGWWLRGRLAPAPRDPAAGHTVTRYSLFQGVLHLSGTLRTGEPVRALALRLPDGRALPVRVTASSGGAAFDDRLPLDAEPAEIARAELELHLASGTVQRVAQLGAPLDDPAHAVAARFQAMLVERPPGLLLEVGSRARSGTVRRGWTPEGWRYLGFDIMPGPNVDVVGDAHRLSRHVAAGSVDAVAAFSVLEHLLMPWKFVVELNRVMAPGAVGLFTTHQTWPLHDEPWDFWRFSDRAWAGLLNPATGFEVIEAAMGEPAYIVAARLSAETGFAERPAGALASFVLFRKTGDTTLDWPVELSDVVAGAYPGGEPLSRPGAAPSPPPGPSP